MRNFLTGVLLAVACAGNAYADIPETITGDVQLMSNYVGRGLAQSVGQPSVSAELDYAPRDGLYGGIQATSINWVDQLYPGDSVSVEVDSWAGYRWHFRSDWTAKLGILRLQFPGRYVAHSPPVAEPHSTEAFGYAGWRNLSAQFNYSLSESFGTPDSRGSWYLDLALSQSLGDRLGLKMHLGRKHETGADPVSGELHRLNDYTDYKLALVWHLPEAFDLTLAHSWTNADPGRYTLNGYNVGGHHTWLMLERDF